MSIYYIVKRTSVTGKKFVALEKQIAIMRKQHKALSKELGFTQYRGGYGCFGGFSAICFDKEPNMEVWKRVNRGEYMPRLNTKAGKEIQAKLNAPIKISHNELNKCIGFDGFPFQTIGYNANSKTYFGFIVGDDWGVKIPKDCKEVTNSQYQKTFKK